MVYAGPGNDRVDEGSEEDQDEVNDTIHGGPGNDVLIVGWGRDKALGDAGDDTLYDTECSPSVLSGGAGEDYLESYADSYEGGTCAAGVADRIIGGPGDDSAKIDTPDVVRSTEHVQRVPKG